VSKIGVLLVDDDDLMRAGLRAVLSSDDCVEVIGEAVDGRDAVGRVGRLKPDVVLMDVRMPRLDGIAATREIASAAPDTRVLVVTTFEDDEYIFGALGAGASGFLLKRSRPEELIAAIKVVAAGEALLAPSVTRRVVDRMAQAPDAGRRVEPRLDELTERDREVLELLARGLSNQEIANRLVVEHSTVKTHVKRILMKLGVRDRVHAVILAYETGIVRAGGS
jgi:DNA-binding NarL/FixJ family response regulator